MTTGRINQVAIIIAPAGSLARAMPGRIEAVAPPFRRARLTFDTLTATTHPSLARTPTSSIAAATGRKKSSDRVPNTRCGVEINKTVGRSKVSNTWATSHIRT